LPRVHSQGPRVHQGFVHAEFAAWSLGCLCFGWVSWWSNRMHFCCWWKDEGTPSERTGSRPSVYELDLPALLPFYSILFSLKFPAPDLLRKYYSTSIVLKTYSKYTEQCSYIAIDTSKFRINEKSHSCRISLPFAIGPLPGMTRHTLRFWALELHQPAPRPLERGNHNLTYLESREWPGK